MNRTVLQRLARARLAEARVLLKNRRYEGAYYLAGYAVECALKACIAKQIKKFDFPQKKFILDSYSHNLEQLLSVSGLKPQHQVEVAARQEFAINWAVVRDWSEQDRYTIGTSRAKARDLYAAICGQVWNTQMAEETLVKEALSDEMIENGASVIEALDERRFLVDAALWLYLSDLNSWRLFVATPEVHLEGPRKAYKRLLQAIRNARVHGVALQDVAVVDSSDPLIQLLKTAVRTDRGLSRIRFSRNTVNGQFIEDALIYRLAA